MRLPQLVRANVRTPRNLENGMRIAALIGATVVAFCAVPAFADGLLDDLNPFSPDNHYVQYAHGRPHHHYRGRDSYMIAPGLVQTSVGPFVYDDVLDEWEHWTDN
jgi:hypothetical protein